MAIQKTKITAHCLVRNEARFIWYAVTSIIDWVDTLLLWDTGSNDETPQFINLLKNKYPEKIKTQEIGEVSSLDFPKIRQQMLDKTKTDWIVILDGDEIWWQDSLQSITSAISENINISAIVNPTINVVGDMYHYLPNSMGQYQIAGKKGHYTIRFMNQKTAHLKVVKEYGKEGFVDSEGVLIQNRKDILYLAAPYLHTTHLPRSSTINYDAKVMQRAQKRKHEVGMPFPADYYYPEAFFRPHPEVIPSVWMPYNWKYYLNSAMMIPLKKIKRKYNNG